MREIYFCFPYRGVGGVSVLFVRVAEYLAAAGLAKCYLIDYSDGYMAMHRDPSLTELIEYPESGKVHIPGGASIIFQSMTPWSIFPNLKVNPKTKVLFWNCHPLNLIPSLPGLRKLTAGNDFLTHITLNTLLLGYKLRVKRFLGYLLEVNAIVFMDQTNIQVTSNGLGVRIREPSFLPIPAKAEAHNRVARKITDASTIIKFLWVGRIVDFKYYPLKKFLEDLSVIAANGDIKFEVAVVGDGEYLGVLKKDLKKYQPVSIKFFGHVNTQDLDNFILNNSSIMLGMGTSALEGAKLGVPTLLFDMSYKDMPVDQKYRWVHETVNYNLGEMAGTKGATAVGSSLKDKIEEFRVSTHEISVSEQEYFRSNHDIGVVSSALLKYLEKSQCEYGKLEQHNLIAKGFVFSCFARIRRILN